MVTQSGSLCLSKQRNRSDFEVYTVEAKSNNTKQYVLNPKGEEAKQQQSNYVLEE